MKNLNDALQSGTLEQQNRRKNGLLIIAFTAVLLFIASLVLVIGSIVIALKGDTKDPEIEEPSDPTTLGYESTTLDAEALLKSGDLLLLDEDHPYTGSKPTVVKFAGHETRPKSDDSKNIYTLANSTTYAATEETVVAFHAMVKDFYAQSKDDDLIVDKAYNTEAGNQAGEIYTAGTAIALKYYVNYSEDPDKMESIYGVEDYQWIYDNAHLYGFVQISGEEGKENIFRYVGQPHATYLNKNGKSFSEYLTQLQGYTYSSPLKITATTDGKSTSYSVYYVSAEETAYVPEHGKYVVSGDNAGGYIITVNNTAAKNK